MAPGDGELSPGQLDFRLGNFNHPLGNAGFRPLALTELLPQQIKLHLVGRALEVVQAGLGDRQIHLGKVPSCRSHFLGALPEAAQPLEPTLGQLPELLLHDFRRVVPRPGPVVILGEEHHAGAVPGGLESKRIGRPMLGRNVVDADPVGEFLEGLAELAPSFHHQRGRRRAVTAGCQLHENVPVGS